MIVATRTTSGRLGLLRLRPSTSWTYARLGSAFVDSPTAVGSGVFTHDRDGTLHFFDGKNWHAKGGRFD